MRLSASRGCVRDGRQAYSLGFDRDKYCFVGVLSTTKALISMVACDLGLLGGHRRPTGLAARSSSSGAGLPPRILPSASTPALRCEGVGALVPPRDFVLLFSHDFQDSLSLSAIPPAPFQASFRFCHLKPQARLQLSEPGWPASFLAQRWSVENVDTQGCTSSQSSLSVPALSPKDFSSRFISSDPVCHFSPFILLCSKSQSIPRFTDSPAPPSSTPSLSLVPTLRGAT